MSEECQLANSSKIIVLLAALFQQFEVVGEHQGFLRSRIPGQRTIGRTLAEERLGRDLGWRPGGRLRMTLVARSE